ncbi:hypothetical protein TNCT_229511 [Trichonephila clavata]|uniref:Uncharacterized protein n=1 Tax=Trichonephila clavata TaxID=2740835 RepID=A0A8X6LJN4_TRICU|nr:hypothetical protein TNCT_729821 [Trichonephila clavata]GFR12280.1 hypothetical protein TNCT_103441 [Trichonephila clavata]GFR29515.1 hypothetical protein TNCT_229511 [Trichonephila clavata]
MLPIYKLGWCPLIQIHTCIYKYFVREFILTLHEGFQLEVKGCIGDNFCSISFIRSANGFSYSIIDHPYQVNCFVANYFTSEPILPLDDMYELIVSGFPTFPALNVKSSHGDVTIWTVGGSSRLALKLVAYMQVKPIRRAESFGKKVFENVNDVLMNIFTI